MTLRYGMRILVLLVCFSLFLPVRAAWAYSYGPSETEPLADAYKNVVAAANKGDWSAAAAAYAEVRKEVEKDAGGPAATAAVQAAIGARNPEIVAQAMRGIVYLNLKRRLTFGRNAINEYATAKTLVNRATVTYTDGMSPYVKGIDAKLDAAAQAHLEKAFDALGNPGVLGVGAVAPKPDLYDSHMNELLASLQPHFPTDFAAIATAAAAAPVAAEPKPEPKAPAATATTDPAQSGTAQTSPAGTAGTEPKAEPKAEPRAASESEPKKAPETAPNTQPGTAAGAQTAGGSAPTASGPTSAPAPDQAAPAASSGIGLGWYLLGAAALAGVVLVLRFRARS